MYWYLSFLRPPPVYLTLPADGVVTTPQIANDLRTELRETTTPIQYTWQRLSPPGTPTQPAALTHWNPPASTYRPLTVPLPRGARAGETWRLGLVCPPASSPAAISLLALSAGDPGVLGVWSEGIELRAGEPSAAGPGPVRGVNTQKGKGKANEKERDAKYGREKKEGKEGKKRDDAPKQNRITRAWPLREGRDLKLVEQTSFDLDKKVWDSGLALASWLQRYLGDTEHPDTAALEVLSLLSPTATVLELGSGTGLVSIALAQLFEPVEAQAEETAHNTEKIDEDEESESPVATKSSSEPEPTPTGEITATDLESAMEIMAENVALNDVSVHARVLDWDAPLPAWVSDRWPDIVIAADVTYNTASFPCLVRTLDALLSSSGDRPAPPLLLAYKQRDLGERDLWGMLEEKGISAALVDRVQGAEDVGETEIWIMRRV